MARREDLGILEPIRKTAPLERRQQLEEELLERYNLQEPLWEGTQRVRTDGPQQEGEDGTLSAGFGAWVGTDAR